VGTRCFFAYCCLCLSLAVIGSASALANGSKPALVVGKNVDVSRASLPQSEVRVVADPSNPRVLLAGSNSEGEGSMRAYGSVDGGLTWSSRPLPRPAPDSSGLCIADPAVAIDRQERQYFLFVRADPCSKPESGLFLARRASPTSPWLISQKPVVAPLPAGSFDDNPWLAVDTRPTSPYRDRLYLAWFRYDPSGEVGLLFASSEDGGVHWSDPVRVNDSGDNDGYPSIAVAPNGTLYVAWDDFGDGLIKVDRSSDGGRSFGTDQSILVRVRDSRRCPNGVPIPAQPIRCVRTDPTVLAGDNRVYVTYADVALNHSQDVRMVAFSLDLELLAGSSRRIGGPERVRADQFWPTSAIDSRGRLWLCFYDTRGDRRRRHTRFSCTSSADGRSWLPVMRVASVASDEARYSADRGEYGDYEGLALAAGIAHPMWTDARQLDRRGEEIFTARLRLRVAATSASGAQTRPMPAGHHQQRSSLR
jgi:hypothetical protein